MEIELTELKNGARVPKAIVVTTMMSLEKLFQNDPILAYELTMLCRNPQHRLFGNSLDELKRRAFVNSAGCVHKTVRDVVLSAVTGEDVDLILESPVKK